METQNRTKLWASIMERASKLANMKLQSMIISFDDADKKVAIQFEVEPKFSFDTIEGVLSLEYKTLENDTYAVQMAAILMIEYAQESPYRWVN